MGGMLVPGSVRGYSETQVAPDVFRVFLGGVNEELARDMLMLRSAELTLAQGFNHFAVLAEDVRTRSTPIGDGATSSGATQPGLSGSVGVAMTISSSVNTSTIQCFQEPPNDVETSDAQTVVDDLTMKHSSLPSSYRPVGDIGGRASTGYRAAGRFATAGYSETQIADGRYEVTFQGSEFTRFERTTDFALLRSAELSLANGFRYFAIVADNLNAVDTDVATPAATNIIQLYSEVPDEVITYDAEFVWDSVTMKYRLDDLRRPVTDDVRP